MAIEIGSQVEVETESGGMIVVEVTEIDGNQLIGDRVYSPGNAQFTESDVCSVFEY